jgi:cytochrome P450
MEVRPVTPTSDPSDSCTGAADPSAGAPAPAYDPLDPQFLADPYPTYARLRERAPVCRLPAHGFWVVSRYRDALDVLRRPDLFSSAAMALAVARPRDFAPRSEEGADDAAWDAGEGVSIVGTDGARHARLRGVVNRGFTPARIAALAPRIERIVDELAAPLLEAGACEFVRELAIPLPVTVIAEMLDIDPERRADFKRWSDAAVQGVFEPLDADQQREVGARLAEMGEYFEAVIGERRRRPGDDLVSVLIRAEEEHGALTPLELRMFVFTLLVAGVVTTTHLLANAMRALVAHPGELAKLAATPELVPSLVEETLRWDAPVQLLFRTATEETKLSGVTLPRDATVAVLFGSANRDETVFPEPDRFDVARAPKDHLAFGQGVHFCLGAALARLEARSAFAVLLRRMREPEVVGGPAPDLRSLVFRGPVRLPLRFRVA